MNPIRFRQVTKLLACAFVFEGVRFFHRRVAENAEKIKTQRSLRLSGKALHYPPFTRTNFVRIHCYWSLP